MEDHTTSDSMSNDIHDYVPDDTSTDTSQDQPEATADEQTSVESDIVEGEDQAEDKPQSETESTFTDKFDPNSLPPELATAYKQMQADYTRKTQEIAQMRKQFEELMAAMQDQGKPQPEDEGQVEYPTDPIEYAEWVKEKAKQEALQEFMALQEQALAEERLNRDLEAASQLDERLQTDPKFQRIIAGMVSADEEFLSGTKSAVEATKEAIALYEEQLKAYAEAEKAKLSEKAQKSSKPEVGRPAETVKPEREINDIFDAVPDEMKDW